MRSLRRNQTQLYYCNFKETRDILDEFGHKTGEKQHLYSNPISIYASISSEKGESQIATFGNDIEYDKVMLVDDPKCDITESSVLFVDIEPSYDSMGVPKFNYVVKKVSKSLNVSAYAIKRVL